MILGKPHAVTGGEQERRGLVAANQSAELRLRLIDQLLQANTYLRQNGSPQRTTVAGRTGLATVLSGRSSITGRTEVVTVYTAQLRTGDLFFVATVSPEQEANRYNSVFRNMVSSIQLND